MKCPFCDKEIDDNSTVCEFCGAKIAEQEEKIVDNSEETVEKTEVEESIEQEEKIADNNEENVVEENTEKEEEKEVEKEEPIAKQVDTSEEKVEETKKVETKKMDPKKRKSIITIVIVVAVLAVVIASAIGIFMAVVTKSSEEIYKGIITSAKDSIVNTQVANINSANSNISLELYTDISSLRDVVDGLKVNSNIQFNKNDGKYMVALDVDKNSDSYLKLDAFANLVDKKLYLSEENIYSKGLTIDIPEEIANKINEQLNSNEGIIDNDLKNKITEKVYSAMVNNLLPEYFTSQKVALTVEGRTVNATDNAFVMDASQLVSYIKATVTTLKDDSEFISYFNDNQETVSNLLNGVISSMDNVDTGYGNIEAHIYTSGLFNSFVGAAFVVTDEYNDKNLIEVVKQADNKYVISLKEIEYDTENIYGTLTLVINKVTENDMDIQAEVNIPDYGTCGVKLVGSMAYNTAMEEYDTSNAVESDEIPDEDAEEIYDNFMDSPLYYLFSDYINFVEDKDKSRILIGKNYIESYDDDVVIFDVPSSFTVSYNGNSTKTYDKNTTEDSASVELEFRSYSVDEYTENIESTAENYKKSSSYKNVKVSDTEKVEVNGVTYTKKQISYSYAGYSNAKSSITYYYTKVNDDYIYVVSVNDPDEIVTESEINKFLTVEM